MVDKVRSLLGSRIYTFIIGLMVLLRIKLDILESKYDIILLRSEFKNIVIICILLLILFKPIRGKFLSLVVKTIAVILILFFCFGVMLDSDNKMFTFTSPSKERSIIIEECTFLLGGWSNVYKPINKIYRKELDSHAMTTDDGYRPFTRGDYTINWISDYRVSIRYGYGSNGIYRTYIVDLD